LNLLTGGRKGRRFRKEHTTSWSQEKSVRGKGDPLSREKKGVAAAFLASAEREEGSSSSSTGAGKRIRESVSFCLWGRKDRSALLQRKKGGKKGVFNPQGKKKSPDLGKRVWYFIPGKNKTRP